MHSHIDYGPRYLGTAVLSVAIIVLVAICWTRSRNGRRRGLVLFLCGYNVLLMALFILGLLADDGYGVTFIPLMFCTAPWSFLTLAILRATGTVGNWLVSGLVGNFVLFVILYGGINTLLLYAILRKTFYPSDVSVISS